MGKNSHRRTVRVAAAAAAQAAVQTVIALSPPRKLPRVGGASPPAARQRPVARAQAANRPRRAVVVARKLPLVRGPLLDLCFA
jgi:hypothetical protein